MTNRPMPPRPRPRRGWRQRLRGIQRYGWHLAAAVLLLLMLVAALTRRPASAVAPPRPADPEAPWLAAQPSDRWTCIVIHHSGTAAGGAASFDQAHRAKKWDELGYHFVIGNGSQSGDGQVEVGSRWIAQKHGAHCKTDDGYFNEHGIGVCLVGNFDETDPTPAQIRGLTRLVRHLRAANRIPADKIYTHAGVTGKTRCPGERFDVEAIRESIGG